LPLTNFTSRLCKKGCRLFLEHAKKAGCQSDGFNKNNASKEKSIQRITCFKMNRLSNKQFRKVRFKANEVKYIQSFNTWTQNLKQEFLERKAKKEIF